MLPNNNPSKYYKEITLLTSFLTGITKAYLLWVIFYFIENYEINQYVNILFW